MAGKWHSELIKSLAASPWESHWWKGVELCSL